MNEAIPLAGRRFGRLTVIGRSARPGASHAYWKCRCDCGSYSDVSGSRLRRGSTRSCGCLAREAVIIAHTTHGRTGTAEYRAWLCISRRCHSPSDQAYANYGGRGIAVCDEWRLSFDAFFKYVGVRPSKDHSLDRINNDGNYEPGNVRWATRSEQANNRRTNRRLTIDGVTHTIKEWSRISRVSASTIHTRLELGWGHAEAVWSPARVRHTPDDHREMLAALARGEPYRAIAERYGVTTHAIARIVNKRNLAERVRLEGEGR